MHEYNLLYILYFWRVVERERKGITNIQRYSLSISMVFEFMTVTDPDLTMWSCFDDNVDITTLWGGIKFSGILTSAYVSWKITMREMVKIFRNLFFRYVLPCESKLHIILLYLYIYSGIFCSFIWFLFLNNEQKFEIWFYFQIQNVQVRFTWQCQVQKYCCQEFTQ